MRRLFIKGLLALVALLPFIRSFAQQGEIVYTEFDPALSINSHYTLRDSIKLDMDGDGTSDVCFWMTNGYFVSAHMWLSDGWWERGQLDEDDPGVTDTTCLWYEPNHAYPIYNLIDDGGYYHFTIIERKLFRKAVSDGHYCYGWADVHCIDTPYNLPYISHDLYRYTIYVDRMAYCTTPDYPLQWGETGLGVGEDSEAAFTLYLNPATGSVTLTGRQLAEARLYSVAGQLVAAQAGDGSESLTVDISGLPAGLYFVAAIGDDGTRRVRKLVKE